MNIDTICVVGLGYIGLPTAAILASRGKKVIGVDVQPAVVEAVNRGDIHIVEPDLDEVVRVAVRAGFLSASEVPGKADAFVIAVPTPISNNHDPDLQYIEAACVAIASVLEPGNVVILESTSPVGATLKVSHWLANLRPDISFPHIAGEKSDIRVAHCPERVLPGQVLRELVSNDRVIGGLTPLCSQAANEVYRIFVDGDCVVTDAATAEMCKLTENSFRDVNIAFANELSLICDEKGVNVWQLIQLANRHPRVNILQPGPGVGGHCIAVDPWFIVSSAPKTAKLIRTAREVNDYKPKWVLNKVKESIASAREKSNKKQIVVAAFGLSFKPEIDDLRESPALEISEHIGDLADVRLICVEPHIDKLPSSLNAKAELMTFEDALTSADVVVLLVDHAIFKTIDTVRLSGKWLVDSRGIWSS